VQGGVDEFGAGVSFGKERDSQLFELGLPKVSSRDNLTS
jgi:hypothetical protein